MHSRIYELSKKKVEPKDFINADYILNYHGHFIGGVVDYVSDYVDREAELEHLANGFKKYSAKYDAENERFTFPKEFKFNYFKDDLEKFKQEVKKVFEDDGLKYFVDNFFAHDLIRLIKRTLDAYIYLKDDDRLILLEDFIRELEPNEKYYIGGVVDFHF